MKPGIGRSIEQGFRAVNTSWAGMGVVAGSWLAVILVTFLAVFLTSPPREAFQEPAPIAGVTEPAAAPATELLTPEAQSDAQPVDLFNQLDEGEPIPDAVAALTPATPVPGSRLDQEERGRLATEWFGRAWPVLVLGFLLIMAANIWLTGGQIGYLVKRVTTQQAAVSEIWVVGSRAFGALLGATGLSLAAMAGVGLLIALTGVVFAALSNVLPAAVLAILGLLFGLAILAGLVWLVVRVLFWFVAIVADRLGPIAGLKASFRATRGHWWMALGLVAVFVAISFGVSLAVGLVDGLGKLIGGFVGTALALIGNLAGIALNFYLGFLTTAAFIRFYEDTKSPAAPVAAGATPAP